MVGIHIYSRMTIGPRGALPLLFLSAIVIASCAKPKTVSTLPVPESGVLHRLSLNEVENTGSAGQNFTKPASGSLFEIDRSDEADTSDKTKFSSKQFGVKGSPRVTTRRTVRKGGGRYQLGKPYTIRGRRYVPREDPSYKANGLASWYGPNFHGRLTANGEVYDQYSLSAAHPTMPLPSYAKVTNLENGSSVTVRVNDRGPFAHNRVIDLSARAAQLLGYEKQGVAKVRVEYVGKAPLHGLDEEVLIASYDPGRLNPSTIPPLPGVGSNTNVLLAQNRPARTEPAVNQINSVADVGFAPPIPQIRPSFPQPEPAKSLETAPRPQGLVSGYVEEESWNSRIAVAFSIIDRYADMAAPQTGMKDLVHMKFGPFTDHAELYEAQKLFENAGLLDRVTMRHGDGGTLLLITVEKNTASILKSAGISKVAFLEPN